MRREAIAAVIAVLLVASLAVGYLAGSFAQRTQTITSSTSAGPSQLGGLAGGPGVADLHSVLSIDKMFNTTLILPSADSVAALNPSLRLAGVRIDGSPANSWEVTIYYSNQTFVNGTTEIDALVGNSGLEIAEDPAPPGVNSAEIAQRNFAAPAETSCQPLNGSLECTTITQSSANAESYIIVQNGLSLFVNPLGRDVLWTDDRALMNVALGGGADYTTAQLLSLAATMTSTSLALPAVVVPISSESTLDSLTGLSLNLNLSTNSNGWVVVTAYEYNTLDRINNVSYGSSWPNASLWQWTEYDCSEGSMMGYEILQGNYAPNNYTQAVALWIHPFFLVQGGCGVAPDNASYSFEPLSVRSLISGTYAGFWSGPFNDSAYQTFAPGTYTVLAGDPWGQVAILHFIVAG